MNNGDPMKKIHMLQVPPTKIEAQILSFDYIDAVAIKFRLTIDTLAELHDQLRHFEFYDCITSLTHK